MEPELLPLLACPSCKGPLREETAETLRCAQCGLAYPIRGGLPILVAPTGEGSEAEQPGIRPS